MTRLADGTLDYRVSQGPRPSEQNPASKMRSGRHRLLDCLLLLAAAAVLTAPSQPPPHPRYQLMQRDDCEVLLRDGRPILRSQGNCEAWSEVLWQLGPPASVDGGEAYGECWSRWDYPDVSVSFGELDEVTHIDLTGPGEQGRRTTSTWSRR